MAGILDPKTVAGPPARVYTSDGSSVHRFVPAVVAALLAVGCQTASGTTHPPAAVVPREPALSRPSPFTVVTDGPVQYVVPRAWTSAPVEVDGTLREGLMASPDLERWQQMDGTEPGVEAAWMKVSRIGVPSDFFYLAAKWPALPRLVASRHCTTEQQRIIVDHLPEVRASGALGDFAATASGTCTVGHRVNRWSYFVAAPSFGPVRRVGLPDSGLYLVVAVVRDGNQAKRYLHRMIYGARFGQATVSDLVLAARRSARMYPS